MLLISSLVLVGAYILIATEKIPKVTVALLGASLLLALFKTESSQVFSYVDFSVIFLLIGMMIIVHITNQTGVFKWLAIHMLKLTKGKPFWMLLSLGLLTAVLSAFLDNVTTVFLVMPITFQIAKLLDIDPVPFLITEILCSNIGGTATLIGDPPNIIIGTAAGMSFMDFVHEFTLPITLILFASLLFMAWYFRKKLIYKPTFPEKIKALDPSTAITNFRKMLLSITTMLAVVVGFILHSQLHIDPYVLALLGASILLLVEHPKHILNEVEWQTIFFFIGLFIIIGIFSQAGGIHFLAEKMLLATKGALGPTTFLILWGSGLISAVVDNIPYTVTMVPLIKELGHTMDVYPLWLSLSLGACLGGNATVIGAAANVVVVESSQANGYKITFWQFFIVGASVTVISLVISSAFLWLRFFV
jgi:Na+/H+ antiporter NhaD/arsenite permease-like protein